MKYIQAGLVPDCKSAGIVPCIQRAVRKACDAYPDDRGAHHAVAPRNAVAACTWYTSLAEPRLLTGREGLVQRNTSSCSLFSVQCKPIRFQETRDVT